MSLTQPKAILIDSTHYILFEDYGYTWELDAFDADDNMKKCTVKTELTVRSGFRWDGASVPKFLWRLGFHPDGPHRAAALIHDFIYVHKGKLPAGSMVSNYPGATDQIQHGSFSRTDADRLFGRMMKEAGVSRTKRKLMQWGVTWFGWIYWEDGSDLIRWTLIKTGLIIIFLFLSFKVIFDR